MPISEENTPLDLDDHGGRTFLRVLLHLTMHDYPPLVSGALHLLFRHFSQRQEVLMAFKQVGLVLFPYFTTQTNILQDCSSQAKKLFVEQIFVINKETINICNSAFFICI